MYRVQIRGEHIHYAMMSFYCKSRGQCIHWTLALPYCKREQNNLSSRKVSINPRGREEVQQSLAILHMNLRGPHGFLRAAQGHMSLPVWVKPRLVLQPFFGLVIGYSNTLQACGKEGGRTASSMAWCAFMVALSNAECLPLCLKIGWQRARKQAVKGAKASSLWPYSSAWPRARGTEEQLQGKGG